jgi:hypothetical protein
MGPQLWLAFAIVAGALYVYRKLRQLTISDPRHAMPLPAACNSPSRAEHWLAARDEAAAPIQPGAGSRVSWAGEQGGQTDVCVVFLHGWSASPIEMAPVDERIARGMRANLLRYRLTGHGLQPNERGGEAILQTATRDRLMLDCALAFACGKLLGKRVVFLGSSCAATRRSAHAPRHAPALTRARELSVQDRSEPLRVARGPAMGEP